MLVLEGKCPNCYGNLVLNEEELSVTCEDCGHSENTKDRRLFAELALEAVEYGPKEKRLEPTPIGKLFLEPFNGLSQYLRETLEEAIRGLDIEEYDYEQLLKYGLVYDENKQAKETCNPRKKI